MITLKQGKDSGMYYYACPYCERVNIIKGFMVVSCNKCSKHLPNVVAMHKIQKVRESYHFKGEIYNVKV